eukprot:Pompholyxophrys_punicea_v1_NODE_993_length_1058_cov_28.130608.p1 type:complete len:202 gc:universal NODE_993_length_1058_cov_28.130608:770-165(-)
MDSSLSWNEHTKQLLSSLLKYIGFFRIVRTLLPIDGLTQLYSSLIESRLTYGIEVWGTSKTNATYILPLYKFQKKLLKTMTFSAMDVKSKPLFEKFKILTIFQLYHYKMSILAYKIIKEDQSLAKKFGIEQPIPVIQLHSHETRNALTQLFIPSILHNRSMSREIFKIWNSLPVAIRNLQSLFKFKNQVKQFIFTDFNEVA